MLLDPNFQSKKVNFGATWVSYHASLSKKLIKEHGPSSLRIVQPYFLLFFSTTFHQYTKTHMLFIFGPREYPNKNSPIHGLRKLFMSWIKRRMNISVLRFYRYIGDISTDILEKNIGRSKIDQNLENIYKKNFIKM